MEFNLSEQFGQNEWLARQMLEKYLKDPQSVDTSWQKIFQNLASPATTTSLSKNNKPKTPVRNEENSPLSKAGTTPIRGIANTIVKNMTESLGIPTATSMRTIPAKLMVENRIIINEFLKKTRGGKISFTHLLGFALVKALADFPVMNNHFIEIDGKPNLVTPAHINLGLAIDLPGKNNTRNLVVAAIKQCENMNFSEFLLAYEDVITRARNNQLTPNDFSEVTISLTNPGTLGTVSSVPRLMQKQGTIVGAGALEYPAEFQGTSEKILADMGIGKIITLTSTYDHRIIQGAESGGFLHKVGQLLLADDFYEEIFSSLNIPYRPVKWRVDNQDKSVDKNAQVNKLISAYRRLGHLISNINPLEQGTEFSRDMEELDIHSYNLTLWDLDRTFNVGSLMGNNEMTLRAALNILRNAYCGHIGVEFNHILDQNKRNWIIDKFEGGIAKPNSDLQKYILSRLNAAEAFENFLNTKYVGQKRFSLEGAESLIPMLNSILETAIKNELTEVIIAMPHRGRLNVLANIVGKPYSEIFNEFEGNQDPTKMYGSGDVKYHLGTSGKYNSFFVDKNITVSLTANPSHLEAVDPVVEGLTRAKQDLTAHETNKPYAYMPLTIHGDAAFAGQGIVAETLNLSKLADYKTGGTIHVVVDNQIGFTTAPVNARSTIYSTDIAKTTGTPIFHVNGNDPEACVQVASLAVEFREKFHSDVIIDLVCYRKLGHNEADDPTITQPLMYDKINSLPSVRELYTKNLVGRGDISQTEAEAAYQDYKQKLEQVFKEVKDLEQFPSLPSPSVQEEQKLPVKLVTAIPAQRIEEIGEAFVTLPPDFMVNSRVLPILEKRKKMSVEGNIDWAFAELLAFGSLVQDGNIVRLAGQDSRRGTFSQRHAIIVDRLTGKTFNPLATLAKQQGNFTAVDSPLSEYAVLGFEYGYSLANPHGLTLWEGQFGDFANGAQIIIDEYISSGEAKWGQLSDLVMLLPHGQEGQGPDHSSARLERLLQLCAESSMTVAWPTTPANYFHLLRRHALDGIHRPLIVLTPKSMLRLKTAVSPLKDFTEGKFMSVLDDPDFANPQADKNKVKKLIYTSGKIFYDLYERKIAEKRTDIAIVRIEQLYPLPHRRITENIESYPQAQEVFWVQEEPANQGAWPYLALKLPEKIPEKFTHIKRISRRSMSATSAGSSHTHLAEQQHIIDAVFA